ncbi:hypothetical protein HDU97_007498 [Phlyctochytrium planicorne]|nr:hypothetical protein HDU97_007498 [Phlyctochytrium planicorne]
MKRHAEEEREGEGSTSQQRPRINNDDGEKLKALFEWATQNGANVDGIEIVEDISSVPSRGAVATRDIEASGVIGHLPDELILSESIARSSKVGSAVFKHMEENADEISAIIGDKDPYAAGLIILAAYIAYARFVEQENSFWWPYLQTLPVTFDLPVEWTDEEVAALLPGSNIFFIVQERRKLLKNAVKIVNDAFTTHGILQAMEYNKILWAYCAIASRAFPKSSGVIKPEASSSQADTLDPIATNRVSELCLYPILDMLNHERGRKIEWNSILRPGISFVSVDTVRKGEVLWNNYGPKGNENLLANYGFVLEKNPEDYFKLALNIRSEDPVRENRLKALQEMDPNPGLIHLLFIDDTAPTKDFITSAMVMSCHQSELEDVVKGVPVLRCQLATVTVLWSLLKSKLASLSNIPDSTHLSNSTRVHMASVYRRGQIEVLNHHLGLLEAYFFQICTKNSEADSDELFDELILTPSNSKQDESFLKELSTISEEVGGLDEETILCLVLINEKHRGKQSYWHSFFAGLEKQSKSLTPSNDDQDLAMMIEEDILPLFTQYPSLFPEDKFTRCSYQESLRIVDMFGISLPANMLNMDGVMEQDGSNLGVVLSYAK